MNDKLYGPSVPIGQMVSLDDLLRNVREEWEAGLVEVPWADHPIMASAREQMCGHAVLGPLADYNVHCGAHAAHKVGEEGSNPQQHNLTQYVCCAHFGHIVGPAAPCFKPRRQP